MSRPAFDPEGILRTLTRHEVAFVLIGGLAATIHGSPLRTNDADICPSTTARNLKRLALALQDLDARLRSSDAAEGVPFSIDPVALKRAEMWNLVTRLGELDVSFRPSGTAGYEDLVRGSVLVDLDGLAVKVASLLDIIRSKEAAGRAKDRNALPLLRAMLERFGEHP